MKRYEKYKKVDLPWIKEVPEHWTIVKIKHVFRERSEKGYPSEPLLSATQSQGVIPKEMYENRTVMAMKGLENLKLVKVGDFVISLRSFEGGIEYAYYRGIISPAYTVIYTDKSLDNNYFKWLGKSLKFIQLLQLCVTGIREGQNINYSLLKNNKIPVPPKSEQEKIAAFLDYKIVRINKAIELEEKKKKAAKKLKKSIISDAVTKGLNPKVKKKPSGIIWIDSIPEKWNICKTLFVLEMPITDGPHTTPEFLEEGVPFISAEAVSTGNGAINFEHQRGFVSEAFYRECCKKYIPKRNDIYMIKSGATTGKVAIVDTDKKFTIWSPLAVFRVNENVALCKYVYYFLQSDVYQKQVSYGWSFGTQQNIGMRVLEQLKVIVPSIEEQQEIIDYLDKKIDEIDVYISRIDKRLEKLKSLKRSLISEVVTGQIDVRDFEISKE